MSEMIIRQAELDELPRIAALKKQIHDVHVAAAKGCALLIAEEAGEPVGYVMYQLVCRPASPYMKERHFVHVEEFCVDENHQRMGIGQRLMAGLKELAREKGCPRIELDVWNFNEGAKQFYETAGMRAYRTFMEMDV